MMLDARPSMEYFFVHVNMCDRIDVILNMESLLPLKVVITVVVIVIIVIFICVLNIWSSSNVVMSEM